MRLRPLLAIAVGALLLVAPAAHAARGMEVAISDEDAMVSGKAGNPLLAYQTAQALNATRMRILVQWSGVAGGDGGAYQWAAIDNAIAPPPTTPPSASWKVIIGSICVVP